MWDCFRKIKVFSCSLNTTSQYRMSTRWKFKLYLLYSVYTCNKKNWSDYWSVRKEENHMVLLLCLSIIFYCARLNLWRTIFRFIYFLLYRLERDSFRSHTVLAWDKQLLPIHLNAYNYAIHQYYLTNSIYVGLKLDFLYRC